MRTWLLVAVFLCPAFSLAGDGKIHHAAPSAFSTATPAMNRPGFWISRHPSVDQEIMTPAQIAAFNARVQDDLKLTKDIFNLTKNLKTESLMSEFDRTLADFKDKGYYSAAGARNDLDYVNRARHNMNLPAVILGVPPRYGLVVRYADVRFLPTAEPLYETPGDADFDLVQNSSLDVGAPVAVIHESMDKKWLYVFSQNADGWVQADRVALGVQEVVQQYAQSERFVVVTAGKADLFVNEDMTDFVGYARMGARFPSATHTTGVAITLPAADKDGKLSLVSGFVDGSQVREGYLPFSARSIYNQAFALLNQPYGWGGMFGQQDCSAFLAEVYATVGLVLPRDSKNQALIAADSIDFSLRTKDAEKVKVLQELAGGAVVLYMRGHILLYLGSVDGQPYAIHAIWAYREPSGGTDVPRVLNRVVVSDLWLGRGSQKGSLIQRLAKIITLGPPGPSLH